MKVTPVKKNFGKYKPGDEFEFPDKSARLFIKVGKLAAVEASAPVYHTRMMTANDAAALETVSYSAQEVKEESEAPWGYKSDGTPRKRPGRPAASE